MTSGVASKPTTIQRVSLMVWLLYWLLLFVSMHIPVPDLSSGLPSWWDKPVHATLYGGLTLLAGWHTATRSTAKPRRVLLFWMFIFCSYGVLDELTQPLSNRTASVGDWIADVTGVVLATAWLALHRRRHEK